MFPVLQVETPLSHSFYFVGVATCQCVNSKAELCDDLKGLNDMKKWFEQFEVQHRKRLGGRN